MKCPDCTRAITTIPVAVGPDRPPVCSSCAMHPGWRNELVNRRILARLKRSGS